jgi:hypothetical protein
MSLLINYRKVCEAYVIGKYYRKTFFEEKNFSERKASLWSLRMEIRGPIRFCLLMFFIVFLTLFFFFFLYKQRNYNK